MTPAQPSPSGSSPGSSKQQEHETTHHDSRGRRRDGSAAPGADSPAREHVAKASEEENLLHTFVPVRSVAAVDASANSFIRRWWMVASAFPMIAGTLGPVASAFSICALAIPWRQWVPPGVEVDSAIKINDPSWYVARPQHSTPTNTNIQPLPGLPQ